MMRNRQADRQKDRQTYRHADMQADRQTGRQATAGRPHSFRKLRANKNKKTEQKARHVLPDVHTHLATAASGPPDPR